MKNYAGGDYAFLAILPTDDKISANEFAKNFTAEDYEKFIKSATYDYKVQTVLPEFKYDYDVTLNNTIENMGCKSLFYGLERVKLGNCHQLDFWWQFFMNRKDVFRYTHYLRPFC